MAARKIDIFMKIWLIILFITIISLGFCVRMAVPYEVAVAANWAYNGDMEKTEGFKFYAKYPGSEEFIEIVDVQDGALREWVGVISIQEGRNILVMTAYEENNESSFSTEIPLEYMPPEPEELPPPMVRFKIVMEIEVGDELIIIEESN